MPRQRQRCSGSYYGMPTAFPDFTNVDPVQNVGVSGLKSSVHEGHLHNKHSPGARRVLSRTRLVRRGAVMLLIGMSGRHACDPEFAAALKSVVIEKLVDAAARPSPCAPNRTRPSITVSKNQAPTRHDR